MLLKCHQVDALVGQKSLITPLPNYLTGKAVTKLRMPVPKALGGYN